MPKSLRSSKQDDDPIQNIMQTKLYRQQHGEILRHLDQVSRLVTDATEQEICLELGRLAGVVKLHLSLEDQHMYPRMFEHADPAVQATAREYQKSMGDLAPAYIAFHEKWIQHGAIESGRKEFISDFTAVRRALQERIARENDGLYTVIDQKNIAVAS